MNYKQAYKFWLKHPDIDPTIKEALKSMDKNEIKEAFYTDLAFGTGGLRGLMGPGTNRINLYTIRRATEGFARYLEQKHVTNKVAIAHDNRIDSAEFAYQAAMVLAAHGIKTYLYKELRPTPMLSFAVRHFGCTGGIMITASHNPKQYNGFKAYDQTGAQLNLADAEAVISEILSIDDPISIPAIENEMITWIDEDFDDTYIEAVQNIKINDTQKDIKIVFSPLHGTGGTIIPRLLIENGYQVYPYEPQMINDPHFRNTKSSNPEEKESFEMSLHYAEEVDADIVMVTDPDADRLGIAVKHDGSYHLLNGNQTAVVELYYILEQKKKQNNLPKDGYVFSTIVTSRLIPKIAQSYHLKAVQTLTGFKFIGEQAEKLGDQGTYVFGCEESYGSLVADFVRDKDAVQAVYLLSEIASHLKEKNITIINYLDMIYQAYGTYVESTDSYMFEGIEGQATINRLMDIFRNQYQTMPFKIERFTDYEASISTSNGISTPTDLPKSDVIQYDLNQDDWIIFRPSGTEPKLKIYYGAKAPSKDEANQKIEQYKTAIKSIIKS